MRADEAVHRQQPAERVRGELLRMVRQVRQFLVAKRLKRGDRCVLLAANCAQWVATDLAIMAEGLIAVPMYARQAPAELVAMMKDCSPALIICGDSALSDAVTQNWLDAPERVLLEDVFAASPNDTQIALPQIDNDAPVAIIYTSGTSGEAPDAYGSRGCSGRDIG